MRNNILTLLVGFVVMLGSVMLFKLGLDKMTDAEAATSEAYTQVNVDLNRRAILYRVESGDTLWGLAERFYGAGRRWQEIAHANNMSASDGLVAGNIIKIPLAPSDAEPEPAIADELPTLSYDAVEEAVTAGRFGLDADTVDVTICRLDQELFPAGALCVARQSERLTIRISVFSADASSDDTPVAIYESPAGNFLRSMHAEDIDGDGTQEIYTIWQTESEACVSRVLKWSEGRLVVISETPDDPMAMLRLRSRD